MEDFKQEIKKEIPEKSNIIGIYNESEERWEKGSEAIKLEEIREISRFVRATVIEVLRLGVPMRPKEVEFDFVIDGKRISFTVNIESPTQTT